MSAYRQPGTPGLPLVEYAYEYDCEPRTLVRAPAPPAPVHLDERAGLAPFSRAFKMYERTLYGLCFIVGVYLIALLAFR